MRFPLLLAVLALVVSGCSGGDAPPAVSCADLISKADGTHAAHTKVEVNTTKGSFKVELFDDATPITAQNFKTYTEEGYFDHVVFHRIVKGFMMQGGKFDNATKTAKTPAHAAIKNEARTSGCSNAHYTLSMARTGVPDSAQTEFFINFKDNAFLNANPDDTGPSGAGYAVFGVVYEGRSAVDAIEQVPVHVYDSSKDKMCQSEGGTPNCPNTPVEMTKVKVI